MPIWNSLSGRAIALSFRERLQMQLRYISKFSCDLLRKHDQNMTDDSSRLRIPVPEFAQSG
jgi:hypothetical protein